MVRGNLYELFVEEGMFFYKYQITANSRIIKTGYRRSQVSAENAAYKHVYPEGFDSIMVFYKNETN